MIREPAIAAGLEFEIHPETKQSLDERLRDAATRNLEALPLLQFCLEALYHARAKRGDGLFIHADYDAIGGVEGALANRAEETFGRLQPVEQDEFDRVMRAVTTADDNEMFTRRWADRDELGRVPATKAFMDAFLAPEARLINFLLGDLHDKLKPIGKLDLLAEISNRVRAYYQNFVDRKRSPEALKQWSTALINQGDVFADQGDLAAGAEMLGRVTRDPAKSVSAKLSRHGFATRCCHLDYGAAAEGNKQEKNQLFHG
jgi:hypothetical protein